MALTDHELLRRYVAGSQEAFSELVKLHLDLVYTAARRQSRSPQMAEEVAQSVFLKLSVSASKLDPAAPLAAWLFLVTRHTAIDAARQDARRQAREAAALELSAMNSSPPGWSLVEPLLDEAMEALPLADRTALLLRYFENKSLREVGAALGSSEDAAQKRVSRAIDELRSFFARRGVAVSATGLVTGLSATAVQAAPASLGASIASVSALSGTALQHALVGSSADTLTMTTIQKTLVAATLMAALGASIYEFRVAANQATQIAALEKRVAAAQQKEQQAGRERDAARATAGTAGIPNEPAAASAPATDDAGFQAVLATLTAKTRRLQQLFEAMPERRIPELALLKDDDWIMAAKDVKLETELQIRNAFSAVRSKAKTSVVVPAFQKALTAYQQANPGNALMDIEQLAPYFDPPMPREILARYTTDPADMTSPAYLVGEKLTATVDDDYDSRLQMAGRGYAVSSTSRSNDLFRAALQQFAAVNNGAKPATPQQLAPYLSAPIPEPRLQELFDASAKGMGGVSGTGGGVSMMMKIAPTTGIPADATPVPPFKPATP